jgi:iron complex transport system substrate-binding protein
MLVGRSHECDNPQWVRKLPACTRPAFDISLSSGKIDAEVRRLLKAGEPLYHVDTQLIRQLRPDLLIAQAHCEVCAVTPADVERAGCDVLAAQVLALTAGTINGIHAGIRTIARALELRAAGETLIVSMNDRIHCVTDAVRSRPAPTVVMLEWTDPLFSMGNWGPELVEAANGRVLLGEKGRHSQAISWGAVREADPDFLIIAPCGYDLPRALAELPLLECLPGWNDLRAVRAGRVAFADGNLYFNRSGTTIVETVEIIAEILHGYRPSITRLVPAWQWHPEEPKHGEPPATAGKLRREGDKEEREEDEGFTIMTQK